MPMVDSALKNEKSSVNFVYSNADDEISFKNPSHVGQHNASPVKNSASAKTVIDQNHVKISSCIKSENLQQLYDKKLKNSSPESSPFKGKLSAFEISLLKGQQNLERRKSMESACLRSSPRASRLGVKRPNYREKRKNKLRFSLDSQVDSEGKVNQDDNSGSLEGNTEQQESKPRRGRKPRLFKTGMVRHEVNEFKKQRVKGRIGRPRKISLDSNDSMTTNPPKRRKRKISDPVANAKHLEKVSYRMNGSRKRQSLPAVLSLQSLSQRSGMSDCIQGSMLASSLHKHHPDKLSGEISHPHLTCQTLW